MKIGVRAHDYGRQEIEQLAATLHGHGFQCTQLAMPKAIAGIRSFGDIQPEHLTRVQRAFADNKIELAVFGCYVDLSNPDGEIRKNAVHTLKKALAYGKEIGARCVGTETAAQRLDEAEKRLRYPWMLDAVKEVVEEAARLDVRFALEPVHYYPLDTVQTVLDVFEEVNDPTHLRMIFDPCNVLQEKDVDSQEAYWSHWLTSTGAYIEAIHIKDRYFTEDGKHVDTALGKGVVRYDAISKWIHENRLDMYLLREGIKPENQQSDIAFMKKL